MTMKKNSAIAKQKRTIAEEKVPGTDGQAVAQEAAETRVTIDARAGKDRRGEANRRKQDVPVAVERRQLERRVKVNRRRQIDPTTCERDYSIEEIEFMNAVDEYKRRSGRMFPTCSEILEVVRGLGYEKRPMAPAAAPLTEAAVPAVSMEQAV